MTILQAHEAVAQHLMALSIFDRVAQHEPANNPGKGIYASMWFDEGDMHGDLSSLGRAGARHVVQVRLSTSANKEPKDDIDLDLVAALDAVIASLVADHTLGGSAFTVDLFGAYGEGLRWETDYVDFERQNLHRVINIFIPITFEGAYPYAG